MPPQAMAIWAGVTGTAVVVAGAAAVYLAHPSFLWPAPGPVVVSETAPPQPTSEQPKTPVVVAATGPAAAPVPAAVKPAFDVVNVEPTGEAVVAGRAAPNAKVELRDAGKTVAEATADASGQFVMIPPTLAPGGHSLSLTAGEGGAEPETSKVVDVSVPLPEAKAAVAAVAPTTTVASPPPPPPAAVAMRTLATSPATDASRVAI